ncbi:unnamed protein product [Urochloa humidicola]
MELKEPLLRDHRAQERGYAGAALAGNGKQPGGDPGAAVSSSDLDLGEAKESVVEKPSVRQEKQVDSSYEKTLDASVRQEAVNSSDLDLGEVKESVEKPSVRQEKQLQVDSSDEKTLDASVRQEAVSSSDLDLAEVKESVETLAVRQEKQLRRNTSDGKQLDASVRQEGNGELSIHQEETGSKKLVELPIRQEIGGNCKKVPSGDKKSPSDGTMPRLPSGHQELALSIHKLNLLREQASTLAKFAAGSSMSAAAEAFSHAVEHFVAGKERKKRAVSRGYGDEQICNGVILYCSESTSFGGRPCYCCHRIDI